MGRISQNKSITKQQRYIVTCNYMYINYLTALNILTKFIHFNCQWCITQVIFIHYFMCNIEYFSFTFSIAKMIKFLTFTLLMSTRFSLSYSHQHDDNAKEAQFLHESSKNVPRIDSVYSAVINDTKMILSHWLRTWNQHNIGAQCMYGAAGCTW